MKQEPTVYKSDAFAAIHELASDLHECGVIDKKKMERFDKSCLTTLQEFTPEDIRELREREMVSQLGFARYLNVSEETVCQWERGEKRPSRTSLKLLFLIERDGIESLV